MLRTHQVHVGRVRGQGRAVERRARLRLDQHVGLQDHAVLQELPERMDAQHLDRLGDLVAVPRVDRQDAVEDLLEATDVLLFAPARLVAAPLLALLEVVQEVDDEERRDADVHGEDREQDADAQRHSGSFSAPATSCP